MQLLLICMCLNESRTRPFPSSSCFRAGWQRQQSWYLGWKSCSCNSSWCGRDFKHALNSKQRTSVWLVGLRPREGGGTELIFPQWNNVPWEKQCCLWQLGQRCAAHWDVLCRTHSCPRKTAIFHLLFSSMILSSLQQLAKLAEAEAIGGEIPFRIFLSVPLKDAVWVLKRLEREMRLGQE